jgi:hypothetical protein
MSGGETTCPCIVKVSTIFVFDTVQVQKAANTVYEFKAAYDALPANAGKGLKYQFKTDFERMQYIIGRQGRSCNPPTVGS